VSSESSEQAIKIIQFSTDYVFIRGRPASVLPTGSSRGFRLRKLSQSRRRISGSVFLDALIALCIVVLAILPIESLLVGSQTLDRQSQLQTVATNIAEMEIETLRSQSFSNTAKMASGSFDIPSSVLATFPSISMSGNYVVSAVTGLGDAQHSVLQLIVTVSWARPDVTSSESSVTLDTYESQGAVI